MTYSFSGARSFCKSFGFLGAGLFARYHHMASLAQVFLRALYTEVCERMVVDYGNQIPIALWTAAGDVVLMFDGPAQPVTSFSHARLVVFTQPPIHEWRALRFPLPRDHIPPPPLDSPRVSFQPSGNESRPPPPGRNPCCGRHRRDNCRLPFIQLVRTRLSNGEYCSCDTCRSLPIELSGSNGDDAGGA